MELLLASLNLVGSCAKLWRPGLFSDLLSGQKDRGGSSLAMAVQDNLGANAKRAKLWTLWDLNPRPQAFVGAKHARYQLRQAPIDL